MTSFGTANASTLAAQLRNTRATLSRLPPIVLSSYRQVALPQARRRRFPCLKRTRRREGPATSHARRAMAVTQLLRYCHSVTLSLCHFITWSLWTPSLLSLSVTGVRSSQSTHSASCAAEKTASKAVSGSRVSVDDVPVCVQRDNGGGGGDARDRETTRRETDRYRLRDRE